MIYYMFDRENILQFLTVFSAIHSFRLDWKGMYSPEHDYNKWNTDMQTSNIS